MRLLVIDGNSIANRAFFGIKLLTTKDGRYTNAIYGFLNILLSLLKECEPDEVAVAFDLKAPTFRHKMYDGYKATRHGMPEELAQQMPVLKELLADLGYRTVTAEGWEADDILGTLAAACAARKDDCFLATGDRDSLQLVSDTTTVLLAATVMGRSKTVTMDVDAIQEKYGIQPRQLIEVKSLMGDASDNIPGVRGIGEKTALSLVQNFGSLEGVYEHIDDKRIKPKQREHLLECREMAELSHTLGTIRTDAPIDTAEGSYKVGEGRKAEAVRLLQELEIHSLIPRFGLAGVVPAAPEGEDGIELAQAELEALPLAPSGTYLVASRPAVMGKQGTRNVVLQPESWYAVQDCTVYPLEDADLVRLLDNADVTLEVFNSAPLYAKAMAAGGWGSSIVWDGKLAAYLLDASASKYQIGELVSSYRASAAFACTDYPDAGRLADLFSKMKAEITACGEDALYNEIEFPLAQVLADMTRTGVLVDKDGIEQFGVKLRTELEQVLTRIHMETGSASFNPNSPKQLGEMLFDTMGLPHGKKTQRGWSTDAETLESLRDYPLVEDILQYRAYQKLNSTYVEGLLKVIGEDGRIQATLDLLGVPYTGAGYLSSAIAMDKDLTKRLVSEYVITPQWRTVRYTEGDIARLVSETKLPCVVKPVANGSSVGVSIAHTGAELKKALEECLQFGAQVVLEQYISGREIQVGIIAGKALPSIEIIPKTGFYDYANKYQAGAAEEICPSPIPEDWEMRVRTATETVYRLIGLSVYSRADFIVTPDGTPYFLEINTLPGMTKTSLLPQEAAAVGIGYEELCEKIVEESLKQKRGL